MRLVLNQPEGQDSEGVRKVAMAYRTPVEEIGGAHLPPFAEVRKAHPDVPWIGLEVTNVSVPLEDFDFDTYRDAVVITGSMNHGLPPEILKELDGFVKVEQFDDAGYLSPTVAVGIFLYERFKHFVAKEHRA